MSDKKPTLSRRAFLGRTAAAVALPYLVPASVFGRDGAVPPSERIMLGGIGIGNRGTHDLQLDAAGAGRAVRGDLRPAEAASRGRQEARGHPLRQQRLQAVRRHSRVPGHPHRHRRGPEHHRRPLARPGGHPGDAGGQGRVLREAVGHDHRRGPGGRGHRPALPADLPVRHPAAQRRQFHLRQRVAAAGLSRQGPHRPGAHRPVGRRRDAARLAAGAAAASEGGGRLGRLAGPVSLAALQRGLLPAAAGATTTTSTRAASANGAPTRSPSARWRSTCGRRRPSSTST